MVMNCFLLSFKQLPLCIKCKNCGYLESAARSGLFLYCYDDYGS